MKTKLAVMASLLAIATTFYFVATSAWSQSNPPPAHPGTTAHFEHHPAIRAAIRALDRAKLDLQNADHDFGGHRATAIKECEAALVELKAALQYDK